MMFMQNFVCAVKVNGKILRDQSNLVTLPFGSEYTILLKNLNSRRAMVKVSVDGQDATDGTRLILAPNSTLELERFIRNGNLNSGNRFKFIERTAAVEAHRGAKEDDGLIRAEFWAEKPAQETIETIVRRRYIDDYEPYFPPFPRPWRGRRPWWHDITFKSTGNVQSYSTSETMARMSVDAESHEVERGGFQSINNTMGALNDAGITVPGSESSQRFYSTSGFPLESNSQVIVLNLRGEVAGKPVAAPITVDRKPVCITCGKTNKAQDRFCGQCGTALELI